MFCPRTRRAPFTSSFINGVRHCSAFIDLYSQLEYKVYQNIQPYIFRSTNYEYQNTLSFLSTINSEYKGIKPQSDRDKTKINTVKSGGGVGYGACTHSNHGQ